MRDFSPDFLAFWHVFPRKVGKRAAWSEWVRLRPPLDDVLAALAWQVESRDWLKDDGQFIPYPKTYLHQGRWEDEPSVAKRKATLEVVKGPAPTFRKLRCEAHEKNPRWKNQHPVEWCPGCREQKARAGTREGDPEAIGDLFAGWGKT